MERKNIIGEVNIEVKVGLSVDKKTLRTCMDLVAIHARNEGIKGMVVRFDDTDFDRCSIKPLMTEEEVNTALYARPDMFKEKEIEQLKRLLLKYSSEDSRKMPDKYCGTCAYNVKPMVPHTCDVCTSLDQDEMYSMWTWNGRI